MSQSKLQILICWANSMGRDMASFSSPNHGSQNGQGRTN
jgi:hypothetical protein